MKKTNWTLVLVLVVLASFTLAAQKSADLVGRWEGEAIFEGDTDANVLTLVLKLEEGKLSGHMTDIYGSMFEIPIDEVKLEESTFSFTVLATIGNGQFLVKFTMTVDGDSMEGKLELPDVGMAGDWKASKQK